MKFNPSKMRNLRKEKGLTQEQFAKSLSYRFSRQNVNNWEKGRHVPVAEVFMLIKTVYGVSQDYFYTNNNEDSVCPACGCTGEEAV